MIYAIAFATLAIVCLVLAHLRVSRLRRESDLFHDYGEIAWQGFGMGYAFGLFIAGAIVAAVAAAGLIGGAL